MYKFIRDFLFLFDPEKVHYFSMNSLRFLCKIPLVKKIITRLFLPDNAALETKFLGINFKNPVGLGAGFDKNAQYLNELEALGFGFVEIGTVTPKAQTGNDKPRLFRLPKDKALINRMGFNNDGVKVIAERLRQWAIGNGQRAMGNEQRAMGNGQRAMGNEQLSMGVGQKTAGNSQLAIDLPANAKGHSPFTIHHSRLIIGGNIGKNKITPNEDAWKDYEICFIALHPYVDYFVVNVSSPNTPGLRELQEKDSLRKILTNLQQQNAKHEKPKPILLKIAPDLTTPQIDDVIDLAMEIKLDGLVAANTTISRAQLKTNSREVQVMGAGGLSGLPVQQSSTTIIEYIHQKTNGQIPIIASGGIFTAADAKEKLRAGALLVQVWTGFVYEGPAIVKNICKEL